MKTCKACSSPVFSHDYCLIHQWMRTDDKYKKYKELKKSGKIARRTKERAKDEKRYMNEARAFFDDAVANKTNYCFFCGKEVKLFEGLHHLRNRAGDMLLDKEFWVVVHNNCHVWKYHQADYDQRKKEVWWQDFLARLKEKSLELYEKELRKADKAIPLNLKLEFEEDNDY